jgi:hypothetical protein
MNSVLENFQALSQEEQKAKLSTFYKRFLSNHPEFVRQKDVNPDLRYYKDYVLSRESITPTTPTGKSITAVDDLPDEDEGNVNDVVEESILSKQDKPIINVYWGSPESTNNTRVLSNLAPRKFTYKDKEYGSVEHAYQTLKSGSFDQVTYDKYIKVDGYGTKIRGKAVTKGFDNLQLMKDLVVESFRQNPNEALVLLNYSDFTHTTNEVIDKAFLDGLRLAQKEVEVRANENTQPIVKGKEVKEGIFVNEGVISKEEQLELFNYLKPFLEEQAAKTNKGKYASKMIGFGLRWDYKSNNSGKTAVNIPDVINPANKTKYGYYTESINGQPLGQISNRFREIISKATGLDMSMYDGAIINLYDNDSFISSHNDVDESRSAINYPVVGINLGGSGNFSIESKDGSPMQLNLDAGTAYVFGVNGVNREVFHRTFPTAQNSFLPELTTKLDNKTYPAGSYRVTITMRRVMPLESNMPVSPLQNAKQSITQPINETSSQLTLDFNSEVNQAAQDSFMALRNRSKNLKDNC